MANSEVSTTAVSSQQNESVESLIEKLDMTLNLEVCRLATLARSTKDPIDDAAWQSLGGIDTIVSQAQILTQISLRVIEMLASRQDRRLLVELFEEVYVAAETAILGLGHRTTPKGEPPIE